MLHSKCFSLIVLFLTMSMCVDEARAQSTQNLVLKKVYVKWLVDSASRPKDPVNFCWALEDQILEGNEVPPIKIDSFGPRVKISVEIGKRFSNCSFTSEKGPGWRLSEGAPESLQLDLDVELPFSQFVLVDSRGRKIEVLVETRTQELQDSGFLDFFKGSVFSVRVSAIRNDVWQIPFLSTKYELPTLFKGRLALQIALGHSPFDFAGSGLRQAQHELALASPVLGSRFPYESLYSLRLRLAYEGIQINDQGSLGVYPLQASQMLGLGSELYLRLTKLLGAQVSGAYYLSRTEGANLSKVLAEGAVNYRLSDRWRVELGMKFVEQGIYTLLNTKTAGFKENYYFVGVNVIPYLESQKSFEAPDVQ
jgi:hypothetical protein